MFAKDKNKTDRTADEVSNIFKNEAKMLDAAYAPLFSSSCACNVYFGDKVLAYADFFQLDISYERKTIPYVDEDGFYRYCNIEHVLSNPQLTVEFYVKIESSGHVIVFSKEESSDTYEVVAKSRARHPSLPADPYVAVLYKSSLFLIFNSPTEEQQALGIKSRVPTVSNGIFCASGRLSILEVDMEEKKIKIAFLSEEIIENIFTCPVSSPVDGRPGLMVLHFADTVLDRGPETFYELIAMMHEEDEEEKSYSTPIGLSVYDFVDDQFDRMSPIGENGESVVAYRKEGENMRMMDKWNVMQVFVSQSARGKNAFSIFEKAEGEEQSPDQPEEETATEENMQ